MTVILSSAAAILFPATPEKDKMQLPKLKHYIYFTLSSLSKGVFYDTQPLFYIAVMALVSYAIRVLPLTLIRKPIKNQFIQSFLYYVPYITLSVMTFPAIIEATQSPVAGAIALVFGMIGAWFGASLFQVSVGCCTVVLILELILV